MTILVEAVCIIIRNYKQIINDLMNIKFQPFNFLLMGHIIPGFGNQLQ